MSQPSPLYYIFIASEVRTGAGTIKAVDAIKIRLEKGYWALPSGTRLRTKLKPGDKVIFYAAGGTLVFLWLRQRC